MAPSTKPRTMNPGTSPWTPDSTGVPFLTGDRLLPLFKAILGPNYAQGYTPDSGLLPPEQYSDSLWAAALAYPPRNLPRAQTQVPQVSQVVDQATQNPLLPPQNGQYVLASSTNPAAALAGGGATRAGAFELPQRGRIFGQVSPQSGPILYRDFPRTTPQVIQGVGRTPNGNAPVSGPEGIMWPQGGLNTPTQPIMSADTMNQPAQGTDWSALTNPTNLAYILSTLGGLLAGDDEDLQQMASLGQMLAMGAQYTRAAKALSGGTSLDELNTSFLPPELMNALTSQDQNQKQIALQTEQEARLKKESDVGLAQSAEMFPLNKQLAEGQIEQLGKVNPMVVGNGTIYENGQFRQAPADMLSGMGNNNPVDPRMFQPASAERYLAISGAIKSLARIEAMPEGDEKETAMSLWDSKYNDPIFGEDLSFIKELGTVNAAAFFSNLTGVNIFGQNNTSTGNLLQEASPGAEPNTPLFNGTGR